MLGPTRLITILRLPSSVKNGPGGCGVEKQRHRLFLLRCNLSEQLSHLGVEGVIPGPGVMNMDFVAPVSPSIPNRHPARKRWVLSTRHRKTAHPENTGVTLDPSYIFLLHQSSTTSSELLEINAEWVATTTTAPS